MKNSIHNKIAATILILMFLLVVYSGLITSLMRFNPNPGIEENRSSPPFPMFELRDPEEFISAFDKYIADNFGMRYVLIDSYAKFRHHVLNANSAENKILEFFGAE